MAAPRRQPPVTKEAWRAFVSAERAERPRRVTLPEYMAMSPEARDGYDRARLAQLGHLGPYKVGHVKKLLDEAEQLLDSNDRLDESLVRRGLVIDGEPTLGKTTVIRLIGRQYERRMREQYGDFMEDGSEYWPVCYVSLPKQSSIL